MFRRIDNPELMQHAVGLTAQEIPSMLRLDENEVKRVAYERMGRRNIVAIALKQVFFEQLTRVRTHLSFRSRENAGATRAYCAMTAREFEGINARQRWANWRTVARNLSNHVPNRPVKALDLCCGVGHSTEVLACFLAPGSRILGLEYNPRFVEMARFRDYKTLDGANARVRFRAQSVLETFCDTGGDVIEDCSIDLVNSCGAVAHHFEPATTSVLAKEVARVLKVGGIAMIDCGHAGTDRQSLVQIFAALGFEVLHEARSCAFDRSSQICFRKWR